MDFKKIEKKWQERWVKERVFEAEPDKREKFFITVPYPYVSGPYHIGHGRSYSCGDVFARYKRLKGYNVLFPMAFHITGTPVLAVSRAVRSGDPESLNIYREYISYHTKDKNKIESILKSFVEPMNVYKYFSKTMRKDFENIGMSLDWRRDFTTGDKIYNKFIEWQYYKLKEKDFLVKGAYPITFCLNCDNAVGEDDIKDGDTNPVGINEFVFLKFKFGEEYIVAGTLRPETVFGQTNLWVDPKIEYTKVKVGNETWIVSKECAEKLAYQKDNIETLGTIKGKDMVGKYCRAPGIEKDIVILPSSFCDSDVASGIVTSVPSDSPQDFVALKELQENKELCEKYGLDWKKIRKIEIIPIIETKEFGNRSAEKVVEQMDIKNQNDPKLEEAIQIVYKAGYHTGVMNKNCGKYSGTPVSEAKELVRKELLEKEKADIFYETSRKALCRCGGKVIIAKLRDQWFLDYNAEGWKELAFRCLNKMVIYPEKYRPAFEDIFNWLDKRPCARRRGLGTKLPFDKSWIIESLSDSTIYMAFYTIAHIIKEKKIGPEQLIPEVFDFVFLGKGDIKKVSKNSEISKPILKQMKKEFEYWYPINQRHTAIMHISNHLSFFIFHHAAIFPEKYWPKIITLIEPVMVEGAKMGKSKGNVIPLVKVGEKYGADLFRLYMVSSAEFGTKVDWKEKEVNATKRNLERFYRLISSMKYSEGGSSSIYSKAVISKFTRKLREAENHIENFDLKKYTQILFYDILNDLSQYIALSNEGLERDIIRKWLIVLSPIIPHVCEELWEKLGNKSFISLEKWPEYDGSKVDLKLEANEEMLHRTIGDIESVIKLSDIEQPRELYLFVSEKWKYDFFQKLKGVLKETHDIKTVMKKVMEKEHSKQIAKMVPRLVKDTSKVPSVITDQEGEYRFLMDSRELLKKKFKIDKVEVIRAEDSEESKAVQAMPGKPAILLR